MQPVGSEIKGDKYGDSENRVYKSLIMIRQDLFNFSFIYFKKISINNNRKSLTMKNFLKIVSVYVGAFFFFFFFSSARMCGLYLIVIQICF